LTKPDIKISMDERGRYLGRKLIKQKAIYLRRFLDGLPAKRVINDWIAF